ncbi:MAG: tRNA (adenosine(37)-N6)-threonylcarbamoyltransferase complex dimerization subunit type 1 TsaB [Oscillospiraceae bacterium]|nr:tRNA (adenosine(37)-N6)-threonylcarbamoyltransferase complex dimerization subunit type 1 TsaB [Oscillospiraceae bacterium]
MKILALETSATTASVAVTEDEKLLAQSFQNSGLTHSATLMPMAADLLKNSGLKLEEMDVIAVAVGPGSFTGVRIGVAAAKGLAWAQDKPCAPCSTLESMAWQCAHMGGEICAVMDARRNQVYNARFRARNGDLERLCPDRAIGLEELLKELKQSGSPQILVGDGTQLCLRAFEGEELDLRAAPPHLVYQSAWGVARTAVELAKAGRLVTAGELNPEYHRLSQAERERLEREQQRTEERP